MSDDELCQLRVEGSYDKFSAMRHMFEFSDYLGLTPNDAKTVVDITTDYFNENKNKLGLVTKVYERFLVFVLRWCCRGLSLDQSMRKAVLEHNRRADFTAKRKWANKKWQKKRSRSTT